MKFENQEDPVESHVKMTSNFIKFNMHTLLYQELFALFLYSESWQQYNGDFSHLNSLKSLA